MRRTTCCASTLRSCSRCATSWQARRWQSFAWTLKRRFSSFRCDLAQGTLAMLCCYLTPLDAGCMLLRAMALRRCTVLCTLTMPQYL